jgi:hypothetical protein
LNSALQSSGDCERRENDKKENPPARNSVLLFATDLFHSVGFLNFGSGSIP